MVLFIYLKLAIIIIIIIFIFTYIYVYTGPEVKTSVTYLIIWINPLIFTRLSFWCFSYILLNYFICFIIIIYIIFLIVFLFSFFVFCLRTTLLSSSDDRKCSCQRAALLHHWQMIHYDIIDRWFIVIQCLYDITERMQLNNQALALQCQH